MVSSDTFHLFHNLLCFQNGTFMRHLGTGLPTEIMSNIFFCLTFVEATHQSDRYNQGRVNDFH